MVEGTHVDSHAGHYTVISERYDIYSGALKWVGERNNCLGSVWPSKQVGDHEVYR